MSVSSTTGMNKSLVKEYFQRKTIRLIQRGVADGAEKALQPISTSPLALIVVVSSSGNSQSTYDRLIDGGRPRVMLCSNRYVSANCPSEHLHGTYRLIKVPKRGTDVVELPLGSC